MRVDDVLKGHGVGNQDKNSSIPSLSTYGDLIYKTEFQSQITTLINDADYIPELNVGISFNTGLLTLIDLKTKSVIYNGKLLNSMGLSPIADQGSCEYFFIDGDIFLVYGYPYGENTLFVLRLKGKDIYNPLEKTELIIRHDNLHDSFVSSLGMAKCDNNIILSHDRGFLKINLLTKEIIYSINTLSSNSIYTIRSYKPVVHQDYLYLFDFRGASGGIGDLSISVHKHSNGELVMQKKLLTGVNDGEVLSYVIDGEIINITRNTVSRISLGLDPKILAYTNFAVVSNGEIYLMNNCVYSINKGFSSINIKTLIPKIVLNNYPSTLTGTVGSVSYSNDSKQSLFYESIFVRRQYVGSNFYSYITGILSGI